MRMGWASAQPLCFLLLLYKKTFYKMGHIDELLATKVEAGSADLAEIVGFAKGKAAAVEQGLDPLPALTAVAVSDTDADSGFTVTNNAVTTLAWDAGATCAATLPEMLAGDLAVIIFSAAPTGANAITFTRGGTDTFEANQVVHLRLATSGSDASVATDVSLALTPAATNCAFGAGTKIYFYCRQNGKICVKLIPNLLGTGAGGTVVFA